MSSPPPLPKRLSLLLVPLRMSAPLVPAQCPPLQMIPAAKAIPAKAITITAMPAVPINTASLLLTPSFLLVATAYGQAKPGLRPRRRYSLSLSGWSPPMSDKQVSIEGARAHPLKARVFTVVLCCELPRIPKRRSSQNSLYASFALLTRLGMKPHRTVALTIGQP